MDKVKALLEALRADDYVRFRYGKALEAAAKELEARGALDARELERRLAELLELVRGQKGGTPASAGPKRRPATARKPEGAAHA